MVQADMSEHGTLMLKEAVNPNAAGKNGIDNSDLLNSLKSIDDQQVEDWKEYIGLQEDVKKTWSDFDSDPLSMKRVLDAIPQ